MTIRMFRSLLLASTCLVPGLLQADATLPTDPTVVAGDITITTPGGTQLALDQTSLYGIVDWGSFSIADGYGVQIQNGAGATLNRVTGSDLSAIFGTLDATGSVYLINQNGILFGETGEVSTGGTFVASTLDIANGDFLDGGDNIFAGESAAFVINLGTVSSLGGDVGILARNVTNEGTVTAPNGTVGLAVGREVLMRDAALADGLFSVRIGGSDTALTEAGSIRAAAVELRANGGNVYALAGNTEGMIAATGVARVNGRVLLTAGDGGHVTVEKTVKATAAGGQGGTITVDGGRVDMAGVLDASGSAGGVVRITSRIATDFSGAILAYGDGSAASGGFAEVSGAHLTFGGTVETRGGTVLIDPNNIEISPDSALTLSGASQIFAASLASLLATQNVIVQTTGGDGEAGTIAVTAPVVWSSGFGLSLLAHGDIQVSANILGSNGAAGLNLVAGWDGSTSSTAFDPAAFLAADLATTGLFGNDTGAGYVLGGGIFAASGSVVIFDAQVGVAGGATRVFGNFVGIGGSASTTLSQLGFNVTGAPAGIATTGDIVLRATGDVSVVGGILSGAAAQIGHLGIDYSGSTLVPTVNASGDILIEAAGDIGIQGGGDDNSYAMVGHGSRDFFSLRAPGDRSGAIAITAGGEVSLQTTTGPFSRDVWIGHTTPSGTISGADITVAALNFDQDSATSVGAGGTGSLDIGMLADTSRGGRVSYTATDSTAGAGLNLVGSTGPISCECNFVNTLGDIVIVAAGDLLLDSSFFFSNIGGGDLVLAAAANVHNNSGADAFGTMKGRWLIYSTRPDQNTGDIGTLSGVFVTTNYDFDPSAPFDPARSGIVYAGNGLLYSAVPTVTVAGATMTYGGALVLPGFAVTVDGVAVDPVAWGFTVDSIFLDETTVTRSLTGQVNAGTYLDAFDFTWGPLASITGGYDFLFVDYGDLTVDQAVLTASISGTPLKVYDGTTLATLTAADFLLSGFAAGEDATITQTAGTFATANAGTGIAVTAALAAGDFSASAATDLANYVLPVSASGFGDIAQARLTATITGTPTKAYDGTTTATLTAANFLLSGFVAGQGATVGVTTGTFAAQDASATAITITTALLAGDFTATGTTLLSNYILPVAASGDGFINPALLDAAIVGLPTKVYDGTTTATLTAANFLLSGFVTGEGATVGATSGSYASANASASNLVTAALLAADFTADSGTNLANYVLPTSATGNGAINQAVLTAGIIGNPTKIYDGTLMAFLTAANIQVNGFVLGEGGIAGGITGTYATQNAGTGIVVTATLGLISGTGGTLMSNYVLPAPGTVTGLGTIDQATLSAAIIGLPTKVFDGTTTATLTAANFLLSGFVAGEGATVTQTAGSYQSAAAGVANIVTADLSAGDFAADAGTSLANYALPTRALGAGQIDAAPPLQPQIPDVPPFVQFTTTPLGEPAGPATGIEVINDETTQRILDEIRAGSAFCKALVRQEYVIDCLSDRLQSVADGLSAVGEYSEVRAALEDAAQRLHALALDNASQDLAQQVLRAGGRRSSRPLTAVATEALGSANAAAAAIIEGAELVLLRSSSGSARRAEAFTQVAQVVNSTKVLLRSS